nr:immunoglobulin heavy chain junction region [Macaca mulatta]MOW18997.1 immunoglobulin heavy chain junction region [Macaca mulatta]MOW19023.1 immunoglobulin heavy chain junction region [Macaca mulatta]MOW19040.1 immunoglobulin heavy chain junction region [Macaca mulatta]MOW20188.1 immunoglobulin heavy chain junction region [Macaca mulatta]
CGRDSLEWLLPPYRVNSLDVW